MEFESVYEGVIAKIFVPEWASGVPVNQLIALMLEEGEGSIGNDTNNESTREAKEDSVSNQKSGHQDLDKAQIPVSATQMTGGGYWNYTSS